MLQLGFLFLALAWLMPGHYPPWMSFQSEYVACIGACFVGGGLIQRRSVPSVPPLAVVAFAAACVPLLQLAVGQILFHADAVLASAYLVGFALCMVAAATLIERDKELLLDGLTAGLVVAAFVSNGIALSQWLDVGKDLFTNEIESGGRPYGNLGQPNHLATLLMLGIIGMLRWFELRRISFGPMVLGLAWLGFGLVMTQSRTAWMSTIVVGAWYVANGRRSNLRVSSAGVLAGVGAFAAGVVAWRPLNDLFLITATSLDERVKHGMRLTHWQMLWDALWSSPWIGYGWMQVSMAQKVGANNHPMGGELLFYSHNLLLDLLLWNGIPIGLLLIAALMWWLIRQLLTCGSIDQCTLLAGVLVILLHGMVEYPLSYAYFLLPLGLMMGALDGLGDHHRFLSCSRAFFAVPFSLCVALVAFTGYEYLKVEEAARTSRLVGARIGVDKVSFAPAPDVWLLDSQREYIRFLSTEAKPGMAREELDWMRKVTSRFTYASAMYRFALAAGLNGNSDEAEAVLVTLCKIHGPERCQEGREGWVRLQERYPQLSRIPFPR